MTTQPLFAPGELVDGKYRITRVLGQGGMGVVYEAHHELLAQPVALKVVLPEIAQNQEVVARFMNEARSSAKIESEHVARVMDVGRLPDGAPFMVMELLVGQDLDALLEKEGAMPASRLADLMLEALDGVAHAHAMGIVHRDLKPANLFLSQKPGRPARVKVLEFGISKALGNTPFAGAHVTSTKSILGSPAYMAPEQLRNSKRVDSRADLWSLGVIAYQLATASLPYDADDVGALFAAILENPPTSPRERRPELSPQLEAIILRCLQKRPEDRYQTVAELAAALAPFGSKTSERALERITGLSLSAPADTSGPSPAITSSPSLASGPQAAAVITGPQAAPSKAPEAFAATHISDAHLEDKAPKGGKTEGSWATPASQATAIIPKRRSPLALVAGVAAVLTIVGLAAVLGLRHDGGTSAPSQASPPATTVAPLATTPVTNVAPSASAQLEPRVASASAASSASAAPSASAPRVTKPTPGGKPAPAASDDLFGRF